MDFWPYFQLHLSRNPPWCDRAPARSAQTVGRRTATSHPFSTGPALNSPLTPSTRSAMRLSPVPVSYTHLALVLLADSLEQAEDMRDHLVRVGIDIVRGFIASLDGLDLVTPKLVQPEELDGFDRALLLDVRNRTEYAAGHLPGAEQLSGGRVLWNLDRLPAPGEGTIVAYCQSGVRGCVDVYKRQI